MKYFLVTLSEEGQSTYGPEAIQSWVLGTKGVMAVAPIDPEGDGLWQNAVFDPGVYKTRLPPDVYEFLRRCNRNGVTHEDPPCRRCDADALLKKYSREEGEAVQSGAAFWQQIALRLAIGLREKNYDPCDYLEGVYRDSLAWILPVAVESDA